MYGVLDIQTKDQILSSERYFENTAFDSLMTYSWSLSLITPLSKIALTNYQSAGKYMKIFKGSLHSGSYEVSCEVRNLTATGAISQRFTTSL